MTRFFILIVLTACSGTPVGGSSPCLLQMSPPRVLVRFGDSFPVNCSSAADQLKSVGLESPFKSISNTNGSFVYLEIPVTSWDVVSPICFINLISGEQCLQSLPVTVYKPPDSVSVSRPDGTGPVVEGQRYRTQVDIMNVAPARNLSVHCHKGSEVIHTETFEDKSLTPVNLTSSFFDVSTQRDDGTQIWCEAKQNFWPPVPNLPAIRSESHKLIVLYTPTFTEPDNETLQLSSGTKLLLDCSAKGRPEPVYSWAFPHAIQRTNQHANQSTLAPSIQLAGTYRCTASNSQGSRTKHFTVLPAERNHTTLAALVGGFVFLGAALFIAGLFFVTPQGTFSFSKGSYLKGQPASSGPV